MAYAKSAQMPKRSDSGACPTVKKSDSLVLFMTLRTPWGRGPIERRIGWVYEK